MNVQGEWGLFMRWVVGKCAVVAFGMLCKCERKVLRFLLRCLKGALRLPRDHVENQRCRQAACHIGPVAQKDNSEAT